jgi:hypothetical protein
MDVPTILPRRRLIIGHEDSAKKLSKNGTISNLAAQLQAIRFGSFIREGYIPDNSRVMSLPREIRNIIFHDLWKLASVQKLRFKGDLVKLYYDTADPSQQLYTRGLPIWLLTNKAFLLEGMEQFHLKTTSSFAPSHIHLSPDAYAMRPFRPFVRNATGLPDNKLLNISTVRELTLRTQNPIMTQMMLLTIPFGDRAQIHRVIHHLPSRSSLRILRLSTEISNLEIIAHPQAWIVNLAWLERFNLQMVTFEYEVKGLEQIVEPRFESVPAWKKMERALVHEVKRIGKMWVGDKGRLDVKVVSERLLHLGIWRSTRTWRIAYTKSKE